MSTQQVSRNFPGTKILRIGQGKSPLRFQLTTQHADVPDENKGMILQLQSQREQIARDLHDGIGSQLTHIISRLDIMAYSNKGLESQLTALRDFASETVTQLRETIWVLNQFEITFGQLSERIKGLLSRLSADLDYPKITVVTKGETTIALPAPLSSSIFRIVQEAVNNALKYATASDIQVQLTANDYTLCLEVIDNGRGFAIDEVQRGYGLLNMQKRTEELSGSFRLHSSSKGTCITAVFPIV